MDYILYLFNAITKHLFVLNIFFLCIVIFFERKTPIRSLFWISLLVFAPYFGLFTFLFFGLSLKKSKYINKFYSKIKIQHSIHNFFKASHYSPYWKNLIEYLAVSQAGKLSSYDESIFFTKGDDFFENLKEDIVNARHTIYMEYFIFKEDRLGKEFLALIIEKAQQGVSVKLLLDGVNSISYLKLKKLRESKIEVEFFLPFLYMKIFNLKANFRNHRKLTIIDGEMAYIGGFNIGKEYIGESYLGNWRDTALKIKGEIIHEFEKEFFSSWNFVISSRKTTALPYTLNHVYNSIEKRHSAQLVSSGPIFQLRTARDNILKMITGAKHSIYIETPYFIPDDLILTALKIAATSGVKIKIIIPNIADHPFVYWVNQSYIGEILEYGINCYRYSNGFLHSKFIIVDDEIASLGTTNIDYRSFYENFEININLYSNSEVVKLRNIFIEDLKQSILISQDDYHQRSLFTKIKESVFRLLAPMLWGI